MIDQRQLVLGVSIGLAVVLCGLVPGLFRQLAEGVRNAIEQMSSPLLPPSRARAEVRRPKWLAALGAVWIAAAVVAYFSR